MQATSLTSRLKANVEVGDWAWWQLPPALRWYVARSARLQLLAIGLSAAHTDWRSLT